LRPRSSEQFKVESSKLKRAAPGASLGEERRRQAAALQNMLAVVQF